MRNADATALFVVGNKDPCLPSMAWVIVDTLEGSDFVDYFEISNLVYAACETGMGNTLKARIAGHLGWLRHS